MLHIKDPGWGDGINHTMLIQHLRKIVEIGQGLTDNEIIIFGTLCMTRQWGIYQIIPEDCSIDTYQNEIQQNFEHLWFQMVNCSIIKPESVTDLDLDIEKLYECVNLSNPVQFIQYAIIQTMVDFFAALEKNDTQYILEYAPYRNLDLISIFEEQLLGEVEEAFDKKDERIIRLFRAEMLRQIEDMETLRQPSFESQVHTLITKSKETVMFTLNPASILND